MAEQKLVYTAFQSIATTQLNSLASGASAALVQVSNSAGYLDVSIGGLFTEGVGNLANESIQIFVTGQWGENAADIGGSGDVGINPAGDATLVNASTGDYISANVRLLDVLSFGATAPLATNTLQWGPVSIAMALGHMPIAWSIIVNMEQTSGALAASGHRVEWRGLKLSDAA